MKKLGKELTFISRINRDGSGVLQINNENMEHLNDTQFKLIRLSITEDTYIAKEFNVYVVRITSHNPLAYLFLPLTKDESLPKR